MSDDENILEEDYEIAGEENSLQDKLKKLREELNACRKEKADYLAGWQRAKADFINARQDEEKSRMDFVKYASEKVLREMLALADSLEISGNADCKPIYNQLLDILKKHGVAKMEAMEVKFDPVYHEALEQIEVLEQEKNGIVLEELQKGYMLYDKVLRPTKVKVGIYKSN